MLQANNWDSFMFRDDRYDQIIHMVSNTDMQVDDMSSRDFCVTIRWLQPKGQNISIKLEIIQLGMKALN